MVPHGRAQSRVLAAVDRMGIPRLQFFQPNYNRGILPSGEIQEFLSDGKQGRFPFEAGWVAPHLFDSTPAPRGPPGRPATSFRPVSQVTDVLKGSKEHEQGGADQVSGTSTGQDEFVAPPYACRSGEPTLSVQRQAV